MDRQKEDLTKEDMKELTLDVQMTVTRSIKRSGERKYCQHHHVEVDEQERTVRCTDCNSLIDAFEYILTWANQEHSLEMQVAYLKKELRTLNDQKAELLKTVSYMKRKRAKIVNF
jgi:hypothetical protein